MWDTAPATPMKKIPRVALLWLAALATAHGQKFEVSPYYGWVRMSKDALGSVSPSNPQDKDTTFHNGHSYGARLTLNTKGYYGHELTYSETFTTLSTGTQADSTSPKLTYQDKLKLRQITYNFLIYFMPRGERWRPFITGGVEGVYAPNPNISAWTGSTSRNYGLNYGGGLKIRLFPHALARVDVRDSRNGKPYGLSGAQDAPPPSGFLRQIEASAGFAIGF